MSWMTDLFSDIKEATEVEKKRIKGLGNKMSKSDPVDKGPMDFVDNIKNSDFVRWASSMGFGGKSPRPTALPVTDAKDVVLNNAYTRIKNNNPKYKDVSFDMFKENVQNYLIDPTLKIESNNKNLPRGSNNLKTTASGYYQFLEDSVETALNRLDNIIGKESTKSISLDRNTLKSIRSSKDSSLGDKEIQDLIFLANMFESEGSDKILVDALFKGDKEAAMNAFLKFHHTLSSPNKAYNRATVEVAKKIWGINQAKVVLSRKPHSKSFKGLGNINILNSRP